MIGQTLRRLLGPFEHRAAGAYRAAFVDLDSLASTIRAWSDATSILEVGCGEGQLTQRIAHWYPNSTIVGIDIIDGVGRLFTGDPERVTFAVERLSSFVARHSTSYDLVILSDVLHHVPRDERESLLRNCAVALAPGGGFVLKDWTKSARPIHWLAYISDSVITGDHVLYLSEPEILNLVVGVFGHASVERIARVQPWQNNLMLLLRPSRD